jgi:hypothetical protein
VGRLMEGSADCIQPIMLGVGARLDRVGGWGSGDRGGSGLGYRSGMVAVWVRRRSEFDTAIGRLKSSSWQNISKFTNIIILLI